METGWVKEFFFSIFFRKTPFSFVLDQKQQIKTFFSAVNQFLEIRKSQKKKKQFYG